MRRRATAEFVPATYLAPETVVQGSAVPTVMARLALGAGVALLAACGGTPQASPALSELDPTKGATPQPSTYLDPASGVTCASTESVSDTIIEPPVSNTPVVLSADAAVDGLWRLSADNLGSGRLNTSEVSPAAMEGVIPTAAHEVLSDTTGRYEYVEDGLTQLVVLAAKDGPSWYVSVFTGCNSYIGKHGPFMG